MKEQTTLIKELCKDMEIEVAGVEENYSPVIIQKLHIKWKKTQVFLVALSSGEGGGGHLFKRTTCLTL